MNRINLSRRALVAALLRAGTAGLAARYWVGQAAAAPDLSLKLPEPGATESPSFAEFFALSQLVTLRRQLNEDLARRMFPLFLDEPWGAQHIRSTYARLLELTARSSRQARSAGPALNSELTQGQAWFAAHLLTTWYLGVYYHERTPPLRVAYAEALMFDDVHPGIPRRFAEGTGFGAWSNPPPTRDRA